MNKLKKEKTVEFLNKEVNAAKSIILLDYKGINVETIGHFRAFCRKNNVRYRVVKNTLFLRALKDTDFSCLNEHVDGPVSILYSVEDEVAPAKVISTFDKNLNKFIVKAGSLSGNVINDKEIEELSKLPSKEVITGRMLGVLNGPARSFVSVLNQTVAGFVNVLSNIKDKKEKEESN